MSSTNKRVPIFVAAAWAFWLAVGGAGLGQTTGAHLAAPTPTLWRFLGIPQGVHTVRDALVNRCGNLPGLERKPPLLRIADPRLAEIDNAAIKKAQQIKAEEDLAPQKIKAIKYLATLGCEKCYGGVEEAMLESLKDCTEEVRYETVKALATIPDKKCPRCDNDCCSEKITEQLAKMAYERDPDAPDCWLEPSARVRRAAMETLRVCCRGGQPAMDAVLPAERGAPQTPVEGGGGETPVEPGAAAAYAPRHVARPQATRDYDYAMEVYVAPRRGESVEEAPDPRAEQSVVVTSFRDGPIDDGPIRDTAVQPATYLERVEEDVRVEAAAPLPRGVASTRRAANRGTAPTPRLPAETNAYGRRYVTWGTPHGAFVPAARQDSRVAVRRGLFD